MTPLAHFLAKRLTLPIKKRSAWDSSNMLEADFYREMTGCHCFEVGEIQELTHGLSKQISRGLVLPSELIFLPTPKTWLEYSSMGHTCRYAYAWLLTHTGRAIEIISITSVSHLDPYSHLVVTDYSLLRDSRGYYVAECQEVPRHPAGKSWSSKAQQALRSAHDTHKHRLTAQLALINAPRIVGRQQHMPHRGLERDLIRSLGVGKFPLHAWTEIKLRVGSPPVVDEGGPHEAHLTGRKPLHACRAHIRVRRGAIEHVRFHWRGDPAIGIKRSRYVVAP